MRSIFLVCAQFALLVVLVWPRTGGGSRSLAIAFIVTGLLLGLWAVIANPPGNFNIRPEPKPGARLIESGPYRFTRHPMYLALLVIGLGLVIRDPVWWRSGALVALALVLHVKAAVEEAGLAKIYPGYAAYCHRTSRLLPFL